MNFIKVTLLLVATGLSVACNAADRDPDASDATVEQSPASVCDSLGLQVRGGEVLPPRWDACIVALRAYMAMVADSSTLEVLRARPRSPTIAELQWLSESELGSTTQMRCLSVLLRLPRAAHDVEVRFDTSGAVSYVSAVHKPLQR